MASLAGWIYQIQKHDDLEIAEPRFLVLSGPNISMFLNNPQESPDEKPIRRGVAGLHQRTEDLGRRTYAGGKILHVFRLYNKLDPEKGGKFACTTAEASNRWISALQLSQEEAEKMEKESKGRRRSLDSTSTSDEGKVYIPDEKNLLPGFHRLVTFVREEETFDNLSLEANSPGEDAKDSTNWILFKVGNGLRFFEDLNSSKDETKGVVVRAVGTVEASADSVFELLMNTDKMLRSQWDPLTAESEIIEVVDGHNDIVYSKIQSKYLKQWQRDRDLVYSRFWRRDQDGSYSISQFAISHPKKPPLDGVVRIDDSPGAWEILPLPTLDKGLPRAVVRHTLELTSSGWAKWRPTYFADFEETVPYVSLIRIAGMRDFFAARTSPTAPVSFHESFSSFHGTSAKIEMSSINHLEDEEMEIFHDSISVPFEEPEDDSVNQSGRAKQRWREVHWSVKFKEQLRNASREKSEVNRSETCPRDLDPSAKKISWEKLSGSLKESSASNSTSCWSDPGSDQFSVRGETYLRDKIKVSAPKALLTLVAVDWFKSSQRMDKICSRPGSLAQSKAARSIPFLLAINLQVPGNPNYSMVFYFASDRPVLKGSLLDKFANGDDKFRNQTFKLIPRIVEGYWAVKRAVGTKACLLGKAISCQYLRKDNYLEIDCDIGASSVARGIIGVVIGYVTSLVVDLAILIEASTPEELPEYLLGTMRVNRLSLQHAVDPPPPA